MTNFNTAIIETKADDATDIVTKALADLTKVVEEKAANDNKIIERLAAVETKLNRPAVLKGDNDNEPTAEAKAFKNYLRGGEQRLTAEEIKTLQVGVSAQGGATAPYEFTKELLRNVVQFSPIRKYARVQTVSAPDVRIPRRTGAMTAAWTSEIATRTGTEPVYDQLTMTPFEAACYVDISKQLLEDSAFEMESELALDGSEEFGRLEGAAFVNGTGTGQPRGILAGTDIPEIKSGQAATLGTTDAAISDLLITAFYALPAFYRANAIWMMNSTVTARIRKLKGSDGQYLWQQPIALGQPATLLGIPVEEAADLPVEAANAAPILIGDFKQGYRIIDRVALDVLADPFSQATNGITRFHMRRRVGGGVVKGEAMRKIVCKV